VYVPQRWREVPLVQQEAAAAQGQLVLQAPVVAHTAVHIPPVPVHKEQLLPEQPARAVLHARRVSPVQLVQRAQRVQRDRPVPHEQRGRPAQHRPVSPVVRPARQVLAAVNLLAAAVRRVIAPAVPAAVAVPPVHRAPAARIAAAAVRREAVMAEAATAEAEVAEADSAEAVAEAEVAEAVVAAEA
jgi:hypothetical protein